MSASPHRAFWRPTPPRVGQRGARPFCVQPCRAVIQEQLAGGGAAAGAAASGRERRRTRRRAATHILISQYSRTLAPTPPSRSQRPHTSTLQHPPKMRFEFDDAALLKVSGLGLGAYAIGCGCAPRAFHDNLFEKVRDRGGGCPRGALLISANSPPRANPPTHPPWARRPPSTRAPRSGEGWGGWGGCGCRGAGGAALDWLQPPRALARRACGTL